jgi:hypothetical protein
MKKLITTARNEIVNKQERHSKKVAERFGTTATFGVGRRGSNREMRRHAEKFGLANHEAKKILNKGMIN